MGRHHRHHRSEQHHPPEVIATSDSIGSDANDSTSPAPFSAQTEVLPHEEHHQAPSRWKLLLRLPQFLRRRWFDRVRESRLMRAQKAKPTATTLRAREAFRPPSGPGVREDSDNGLGSEYASLNNSICTTMSSPLRRMSPMTLGPLRYQRRGRARPSTSDPDADPKSSSLFSRRHRRSSSVHAHSSISRLSTATTSSFQVKRQKKKQVRLEALARTDFPTPGRYRKPRSIPLSDRDPLSYIEEVRRYGVILICRSRVLCVFQKESGCFGFPKGSAEGDENSYETAARELFEETGLLLRAELIASQHLRKVTRWSHTMFPVVVDREYPCILHDDNDEITEWRWMTLAELEQVPTSKAVKAVFDQVRARVEEAQDIQHNRKQYRTSAATLPTTPTPRAQSSHAVVSPPFTTVVARRKRVKK